MMRKGLALLFICSLLAIQANAATTVDGQLASTVVADTVTADAFTDGTMTITGGVITGATGTNSQWTNSEGYLTENETIAVSGAVSGSGTDTITTTLASHATSTVINGMQTNLRLLNYANQVYRVDLNRYTDEFADENGIDATSSTNESYDSSDDFYEVFSGATSEEEFLTFTDKTASTDSLGHAVAYVDSVAMSFQLSTGRDIKYAQVYIDKTSTPGNITVTIEGDSGGHADGSAVSTLTSTITEGAVGASAAWVTCTFSTAGALSASTTYWLVLTLAGDPGGGEAYSLYGDADNTYTDGHFEYHPNGGSWTDGVAIADMAFKIQYIAFPATATLITESIPATAAPDNVGVVVWAALGGSATQTVSVSRDGGSNYTDVSLTEIGTESGVIKSYYGTADISGQPSNTSMILKNIFYAGVNIYGEAMDYSDAL